MAFEQPLEADKIGDNSLVSLIRDPIIGALTWILVGPGGSSNKIMMDDDNSSSSSSEVEQQLQRELEDMVLSDDSYGSSGWSRQESRYPSSGEEEGRLPRLVRSEVSVSEQQQQQQPTTMSRVKATVELNTSSSSPTSNPHIGGEKKKMSWSENLVEYMDEVSFNKYHSYYAAESAAMVKASRLWLRSRTGLARLPLE